MGSGNSAHLLWVQVGCEVHMAVSCVAANSLGWMDQRRMSEGQVLTGMDPGIRLGISEQDQFSQPALCPGL